MLRLSKKVEYGLMALLHMDTCRSGNLVPAKEIAEKFSIPPELLGKVLQSMAKAGLIESTKGAHGGYHLGRSLEQITVGSVIEALDGPISLTPCCEDPSACHRTDTCNIRKPIQRLQQNVVAYIRMLSLSEFSHNGGLGAGSDGSVRGNQPERSSS